eukprot:IDg12901t1
MIIGVPYLLASWSDLALAERIGASSPLTYRCMSLLGDKYRPQLACTSCSRSENCSSVSSSDCFTLANSSTLCSILSSVAYAPNRNFTLLGQLYMPSSLWKSAFAALNCSNAGDRKKLLIEMYASFSDSPRSQHCDLYCPKNSKTVRIPAEIRVSLDAHMHPNVVAKSRVDLHYNTHCISMVHCPILFKCLQ